MELSQIDVMIVSMESELAELDLKLNDRRTLQERRDTVYFTLQGLRKLRSESSLDRPPVTPYTSKLTGLETGSKPTVWEGARAAIERAGRPLELEDIRRSMVAMGWTFAGRVGREHIRIALSRRSDIFEKGKDGRYKLIQK